MWYGKVTALATGQAFSQNLKSGQPVGMFPHKTEKKKKRLSGFSLNFVKNWVPCGCLDSVATADPCSWSSTQFM